MIMTYSEIAELRRQGYDYVEIAWSGIPSDRVCRLSPCMSGDIPAGAKNLYKSLRTVDGIRSLRGLPPRQDVQRY